MVRWRCVRRVCVRESVYGAQPGMRERRSFLRSFPAISARDAGLARMNLASYCLTKCIPFLFGTPQPLGQSRIMPLLLGACGRRAWQGWRARTPAEKPPRWLTSLSETGVNRRKCLVVCRVPRPGKLCLGGPGTVRSASHEARRVSEDGYPRVNQRPRKDLSRLG